MQPDHARRGNSGGLEPASDSPEVVGERGSKVRVISSALEARRFPTPPSKPHSRRPGTGLVQGRDYSKAMWAEAYRKIRTFVVANGLDLFVTTTYAEGVRDLNLLRSHCAAMVATLRREVFDGKKMPWLYVPEFHKKGTLHPHWFLPAEVAPVVDYSWMYGHVDIQRLPEVEDQRVAALYVTEFFDTLPPGTRRYEPARGFKPEHQDYDVGDRAEAEAVADRLMGGRPRSKKQPKGHFGCDTTYWDEF